MSQDRNVALEAIEDALWTYHQARQYYLKSVHGVEDVPDTHEAKSKLHISVVNLYLTLEPYSSHAAIDQQWDETILFQSDDGPVGIEEVGKAIEHERVKTQPNAMDSGETQVKTVEKFEPETAIRIGQVLWELARELGADIEKSLSETSKL